MILFYVFICFLQGQGNRKEWLGCRQGWAKGGGCQSPGLWAPPSGHFPLDAPPSQQGILLALLAVPFYAGNVVTRGKGPTQGLGHGGCQEQRVARSPVFRSRPMDVCSPAPAW